MAKPVNLRLFTNEERKILVDAIPHIREKGLYWFKNPQLNALYKKWIRIPNNPYQDGGLDQFKYAVAHMRRSMPLTIKTATGYDMKAEYSHDGVMYK